MIECTYALYLEKSVAKVNPGVPRGWKKSPKESENHQSENPGVSKVEISQGTPGFGVFEESLGIPNLYIQQDLELHGLKKHWFWKYTV